jgi:hypothetical protein
MMGRMLDDCDAFVTTSEGAKRQVTDIYPSLASRNFSVIPHGRDFADMTVSVRPPRFDAPVKILLPGNLDAAKGANFILALRDADTSGLFEFHVLGSAAPELCGPRIILHGVYRREQFAARAAAVGARFGAIFSIWPETYCHTLTELWSIGLPVLAFDLGAVAERIRDNGGGWLVPHDDVANLFRSLVDIVRDARGYERKVEEVLAWQNGEGHRSNVEHMADRYAKLYERLWAERAAFATKAQAEQARSQVYVLSPGNPETGLAPGSTHVRVWERTRARNPLSLQYRHVGPFSLLNAIADDKADAALIQRNAVPPILVDDVIGSCAEHKVPIVLEIDDDLLSPSAAVDMDGSYIAGVTALEKLLRAASALLVSTPYLASRLARFGKPIHLVENALSNRLWFGPLAAPAQLTEETRRTSSEQVRILYMGTPGHGSDLEFVRGPIECLKATYPQVELFVIGAVVEPASWRRVISVPDAAKNYPEFVPWFRGVAETMDFAIAPLREDQFNLSKSGLKFLEYAGAGLTGIFSDVPVYRDMVERSGTGRLAGNTHAEWLESLRTAVENVEEMRAKGRSACEWTKQNAVLEDTLASFENLLVGLALQRQAKPARELTF